MPKRRTPGPSRPGGSPLLLIAVGMLAVVAAAVAFFWPLSGQPPESTTTDSGAPGRLAASQPIVDLGRVPFDKMVEANFELANVGGRPVRLGKPSVKTIEGC